MVTLWKEGIRDTNKTGQHASVTIIRKDRTKGYHDKRYVILLATLLRMTMGYNPFLGILSEEYWKKVGKQSYKVGIFSNPCVNKEKVEKKIKHTFFSTLPKKYAYLFYCCNPFKEKKSRESPTLARFLCKEYQEIQAFCLFWITRATQKNNTKITKKQLLWLVMIK